MIDHDLQYLPSFDVLADQLKEIKNKMKFSKFVVVLEDSPVGCTVFQVSTHSPEIRIIQIIV